MFFFSKIWDKNEEFLGSEKDEQNIKKKNSNASSESVQSYELKQTMKDTSSNLNKKIKNNEEENTQEQSFMIEKKEEEEEKEKFPEPKMTHKTTESSNEFIMRKRAETGALIREHSSPSSSKTIRSSSNSFCGHENFSRIPNDTKSISVSPRKLLFVRSYIWVLSRVFFFSKDLIKVLDHIMVFFYD